MNLLLLLSALLSAITGISVGGQAAPVAAEQVAQASRVAAQAVAAVPARVAALDATVPARVALLTATPVSAPTVPGIPAFRDRPRE